MKTSKIDGRIPFSALAIAGSLACAAVSGASTLTYNGGGNWNTTDANWTDETGASATWADGNSAAFPAGKGGWVLISGTRQAEDVFVNGTGYILNWGGLKVNGKFTANADCTFRAYVAGESIRFGGGPSGTRIWFESEAGRLALFEQATTYLEDSIGLSLNSDLCFGPVPATPAENIVVLSGNPYLQGNISLHSNRNVKINSGATLRIGSGGAGQTLSVNGVVSGEPDPDLGFVTNACVASTHLKDAFQGGSALNPGAGRTNDIGRLLVYDKLTIASGTTRIGAAAKLGTAANAPLYVHGNSSAPSETRGNLVVSGATLFGSQSDRYAHVDGYGRVTVTNGGRIFMPNAHWLNAAGDLTVTDGGEFTASILRVSHSAVSTIHLDDGGLIAVNKLGIDPASSAHACQFSFNGGRIQSRDGRGLFFDTVTTTATTDSDWDTVVFSVGEKGAGFDSTNGQNIWWTRPLVQASGVEDDGGVFVVGTRTDRGLILTKANTYNGPTVVSNAELQVRADNALPSGSTLRLVGGVVWADTFETESPARRTVQSLGRLEGSGTIYNSWNVTVNGAIAPDTDGTLYLAERCSLSGDYEIRGDAGGCGCLKVAAGQSVAGLTLNAADMAAMDTGAARNTYKILDAPNGYSGQFALAADFPSDKWKVRYTTTAAYVDPVAATMIIMR